MDTIIRRRPTRELSAAVPRLYMQVREIAWGWLMPRRTRVTRVVGGGSLAAALVAAILTGVE